MNLLCLMFPSGYQSGPSNGYFLAVALPMSKTCFQVVFLSSPVVKLNTGISGDLE